MKGILLSGGLDSAALCYMEKPDIAFNINYGQSPAIAERKAATEIAKALKIPLVPIDIDCSSLGSGDLVNSEKLNVAPESDWWPYRNQLLITLCAMKAVSVGCTETIIGSVSSDQYHIDGSMEFIEKMDALVSIQEGNIKISAPAISYSAVELIKKSEIPFELLAWCHSCHKSNVPCGQCRGCNKYFDTMHSLGIYVD